MHMISKKDLNSAELETVTTSRSPTTVITANGEVQMHEEATVYVNELGKFLTTKVLEDTPAVLSPGKLCDEHGYSYEWINGPKPHPSKNGIRIQCNTENFVPIVVPGLSSSSSSSLPTSRPMTPSIKAGNRSFQVFFKLVYLNTMTSSTEIVHSDHPPAIASSESVDRQVRGDPYSSETSEEFLHEPTKIPKPNRNENHEQVLGGPLCAEIPEWLQEFRETWMTEFLNTETHTPVLLMNYLQSPHSRDVRICVSTVLKLISLKTDISRSVRGPFLQGLRAEDAMAEPYLVQKILVI